MFKTTYYSFELPCLKNVFYKKICFLYFSKKKKKNEYFLHTLLPCHIGCQPNQRRLLSTLAAVAMPWYPFYNFDSVVVILLLGPIARYFLISLGAAPAPLNDSRGQQW